MNVLRFATGRIHKSSSRRPTFPPKNQVGRELAPAVFQSGQYRTEMQFPIRIP